MSYINTYAMDISCVHGHVVCSCVYRAFVRMYMIQIVCKSMSSFRAYVCPAFMSCICHEFVCMYVCCAFVYIYVAGAKESLIR